MLMAVHHHICDFWRIDKIEKVKTWIKFQRTPSTLYDLFQSNTPHEVHCLEKSLLEVLYSLKINWCTYYYFMLEIFKHIFTWRNHLLVRKYYLRLTGARKCTVPNHTFPVRSWSQSTILTTYMDRLGTFFLLIIAFQKNFVI